MAVGKFSCLNIEQKHQNPPVRVGNVCHCFFRALDVWMSTVCVEVVMKESFPEVAFLELTFPGI